MSFKEDFGKVPLCNHRADRGIYIRGFCLPLCARCTGLLAGSIAGEAVLHLFNTGKGSARSDNSVPLISLAVGCAMLAPTAVDGAAEYFAGKESNNKRRLLTGLLAGGGCAVIEKSLIDLVRK